MSGWCSVSFQMSVCDTLLPAGPHWQAHVIPVTFPEPSHFIRTVINHCWNNVVAWNTGAATALRRRASAARGLLGTRQGARGKALPWWSLGSIEDHHPAVTSVGIGGCNFNPRAGIRYLGLLCVCTNDGETLFQKKKKINCNKRTDCEKGPRVLAWKYFNWSLRTWLETTPPMSQLLLQNACFLLPAVSLNSQWCQDVGTQTWTVVTSLAAQLPLTPSPSPLPPYTEVR